MLQNLNAKIKRIAPYSLKTISLTTKRNIGMTYLQSQIKLSVSKSFPQARIKYKAAPNGFGFQ